MYSQNFLLVQSAVGKTAYMCDVRDDAAKPELIDSCSVRNPALFLSHARFFVTHVECSLSLTSRCAVTVVNLGFSRGRSKFFLFFPFIFSFPFPPFPLPFSFHFSSLLFSFFSLEVGLLKSHLTR